MFYYGDWKVWFLLFGWSGLLSVISGGWRVVISCWEIRVFFWVGGVCGGVNYCGD